MIKEYISKSEKDTIAFAKEFAKDLNSNSVIVLNRRFRNWEN